MDKQAVILAALQFTVNIQSMERHELKRCYSGCQICGFIYATALILGLHRRSPLLLIAGSANC